MFRPTQTAPTRLTAFNIVVGFCLSIGLLVLALLTTADLRVLAEMNADRSQHSGLFFLTAVFVFAAALRPLAGGLLLMVMGIVALWFLPLIGIVAVVFAVLSLLRAYLSRRYLASAGHPRNESQDPGSEV